MRRICVLSILVISAIGLSGCATLPHGRSKDGDGAVPAWLRSLFRDGKLPASARNVRAYAERHSVGDILLARFDSRTKDLEEALTESFWLAHPRALVEEGEDTKMLMPPFEKECPWWTPSQARRFGSVNVVRYYRDRLDGETSLRKFYCATTTKVGVGDAGPGRSVIFIQVVVNEPEQERE